jgi:hypothetical protein
VNIGCTCSGGRTMYATSVPAPSTMLHRLPETPGGP